MEEWHPTAYKAEFKPNFDYVSLEDFMHLKKLHDDLKKQRDDLNRKLCSAVNLNTKLEQQLAEAQAEVERLECHPEHFTCPECERRGMERAAEMAQTFDAPYRQEGESDKIIDRVCDDIAQAIRAEIDK